MKSLFYKIFLIIMLIMISVLCYGQSYEATIEQSISGNTLNVDLKLRTVSGTSDILGDATLVIDYNSAALTYVGKDPSSDGRWDNDNSSSYNDLTSSNVPPRASLDITKSGSGSGLNIPTSVTQVGRITFTITDFNANSGVSWNTLFTSIFDFNGTDIKSSFTFINPGDFSLPVKLSSFTADAGNGFVVLKWATDSEVNNEGFEIYRADDESSDYILMSSFQADSSLKGHGNSNTRHQYTFIDNLVVIGQTYWYKIADVDFNGIRTFHGPKSVTIPLNSEDIIPISTDIPKNFRLYQNFPNPFNPSTTIQFDIPSVNGDFVDVTLNIYNSLGQTVNTIFQGKITGGSYQAQWDGTNAQGTKVPSGIYYAVLKAGYLLRVNKMILMK